MAFLSQWQTFLKERKVEDLLGAKPTEELKAEMINCIAFLNKDDSVKEAIDQLTINKILAIPVFDDDANQFVGFVDMLDLVTLYVRKPMAPIERMPVSEAIDLSGRNAWKPLDRTTPMSELFEALTKPDLHRVPIIDAKAPAPEKKVLAIITQAELIRWLWASRSSPGFPATALSIKIKDMLSSAVHEFGKQRALVLIEENNSAFDAFRKIVEKKVYGLGVISASGELVGNVSATDLRVASAMGWHDLTDLLKKPLHEFLRFKSSLMISFNEHASPSHPITVTLDDTLSAALEKLAANHIHRVWIVRNQPATTGTGASVQQLGSKAGGNVPVGCISMTDVIYELSYFNA